MYVSDSEVRILKSRELFSTEQILRTFCARNPFDLKEKKTSVNS
jgi:hypothetical protein